MAYTYRQDVRFLEDCNPALVERNALEFKRLRDLMLDVEPGAKRAATHTQWVSENRRPYDNRMHYTSALETAKSHYADGKAAEQTLAGLISQVAEAETREAQEAGPMHQ
jgi:hypothetical protein